MNDGLYASIFFLIFAFVLLLYGAALTKTGNKELLPWRAQHSIRNADDVRRVGRVTCVVALIIAAVSIVFIVVCQMV